MKRFLSEAANVRPSERQKIWFDINMYAFGFFISITENGIFCNTIPVYSSAGRIRTITPPMTC